MPEALPPKRGIVPALVLALLALAPGADALADTGLTLPRFVSLRATEVNLRTGPGVRYPVDWVYVRKDLPVEIIAEYETWRRIRDWQGTEGWVHQSMLSGRRSVLLVGEVRTLRRKPSTDSPAVAHAEPGVIGRLLECATDWCDIEVKGFEGWVERTHVWGVYPDELVE